MAPHLSYSTRIFTAEMCPPSRLAECVPAQRNCFFFVELTLYLITRQGQEIALDLNSRSHWRSIKVFPKVSGGKKKKRKCNFPFTLIGFVSETLWPSTCKSSDGAIGSVAPERTPRAPLLAVYLSRVYVYFSDCIQLRRAYSVLSLQCERE